MDNSFDFKRLPDLENETLLLRRLTLKDAQDMFEYSSLPIVTRYISYHHDNISEAEDRLRKIEEKYAAGGCMLWGIEQKPYRKLIGICGFTNWNKIDNIGEITYTLNPGFWGKGIGTNAVKMIIDFGFKIMLLNRIEARCWVENIASESLMIRCKMKFEGVLRKQLLHKGDYHDVKIYSILLDEHKD